MIKLREFSHPYGKGVKYVFGCWGALPPKPEPGSIFFPSLAEKELMELSATKTGKRKCRPFDTATRLQQPKRVKLDGKTGLSVNQDEEESAVTEHELSKFSMNDAMSWTEWEQEKQRVTDYIEASKSRISATPQEISHLDSDLAAIIIEINDSIFRQNEYKAVEKKDILDLGKAMMGWKRPEGLVTEIPKLQSSGDVVDDGFQPVFAEVNEFYFERDGVLHY